MSISVQPQTTALADRDEPGPPTADRTSATDAALIAAAVAGAEPAFRELFRRHTPHLLQFVTRVLGKSRADAEDVVQDAWLRAYPALVTFRGDSSFSTWLCSVGLRAALDWMRKNSRHSTEQLFDDDPPVNPPLNEERMDLEAAIARLAPGYRMILVLHDVEGFTHEEIGRQLGIAPGTSKAQLFKARRVMRVMLSGRRDRS